MQASPSTFGMSREEQEELGALLKSTDYVNEMPTVSADNVSSALDKVFSRTLRYDASGCERANERFGIDREIDRSNV